VRSEKFEIKLMFSILNNLSETVFCFDQNSLPLLTKLASQG